MGESRDPSLSLLSAGPIIRASGLKSVESAELMPQTGIRCGFCWPRSLPARERELKFATAGGLRSLRGSLPARERELKY